MQKRMRWAVVATLAWTACGDSSGPADDPSVITGTYTLRTINGTALPFTLGEFEDFKLEILSDAFTFASDKTFRDIIVTRETDAGVATTSTDTINGTYAITNSAIVLTNTENETLSATLSGGNTMTAVGEGFTLVYRK